MIHSIASRAFRASETFHCNLARNLLALRRSPALSSLPPRTLSVNYLSYQNTPARSFSILYHAKRPLVHSHITSLTNNSRSLTSAMSANGEARTKRRGSPVSAIERPKKQLRQENGVQTPGDATPQNGSLYNVEDEMEDVVPISNTVAAVGDSPEWQATIETVIKSVVSIHFCQTCSFDTDLSTSSQATGFVVDAERGYILTNRHVVGSGPFWGYCVFDNHEEVCGTYSVPGSC